MGICLDDEVTLELAYNEFVEEANYRIQRFRLPSARDDFYACFRERDGIVINTIHGIKGQEYMTVIAFDLLNYHLPNIEYFKNEDKIQIRASESNKLLYVLCSRAKKNLFLISERGRYDRRNVMLSPTSELDKIQFEYDNE